MPLSFLPDTRLYTDYAHFASSFAWCPPEGPPSITLYHCFWQGRLNALHHLSLKSLLATQSPPYEVWLWLPEATRRENDEFLAAYDSIPAVKVRTYVPQEEAAGTPFAGHERILTRGAPPLVSDAFRTLILLRYGGLYFDLDVLFLKDLRPLTSCEFLYPWSDRPCGNTAIVFFREGSANIRAIAERGVELGHCHPRHLYRFDDLEARVHDLHVLPTFAFDPVWLAADHDERINGYCNHPDDFFSSRAPMRMARFFPGSYTYHWHNRWERPLLAGTIAAQLYDEVSSKFEAVKAGDRISSSMTRR